MKTTHFVSPETGGARPVGALRLVLLTTAFALAMVLTLGAGAPAWSSDGKPIDPWRAWGLRNSPNHIHPHAAPPAVIVVPQSPVVVPRAVWMPGSWAWSWAGWVWVPGHWAWD
ncbi:MAG: hypothetical protein AUH81_12335 [Candidatus Rokubacteria bacterium 13_1_40CM_4_69_5]|nr:MAG: hypothetical protein AUH81_12335 [Candidatus Rokubacteria bacterium 13_1_40CM_4_69_5]OLE38930.1 MAG: hypothetical protein AUG00_03950 [Candidatus Rokubacteria bacterium 13_1_20CM_2_70_7]